MNPAGFGDIEPEDAWDATDPIAAQLHNLIRRLHAVLDADTLPSRTRQRLELLADDLADIRDRIAGHDG